MIKNVLIYNSGGGVGDSLQILPLIKTLKNELKNTNFFYIGAHENYFNSKLKDFNCPIKTLDMGIKYFGFRWWHLFYVKWKSIKNNFIRFDLIIDLQSKIRNSLILKQIPHKYFISGSLNFKLSEPSFYIEKNKKFNQRMIDAINYVLKTNYKLYEYDLNNISKDLLIESKKLLPSNNYIGLSITQGNVYRKKEWPLNKIIDLCKIFKKKNKIPVFFIEKKYFDLKEKILKIVPEALFPEHMTNISSPALVTCLAKRLEFAISIDNGVMHMLSLSKVPMIILFGPTNAEKFAPTYKGAIILDSKKIYKTPDISTISVEDVLKALKQHLNF